LVSLHYDASATTGVDEVADFSEQRPFGAPPGLPRDAGCAVLIRGRSLRSILEVPPSVISVCSEEATMPKRRDAGRPHNRYNPAHPSRDRDFTVTVGSDARWPAL